MKKRTLYFCLFLSLMIIFLCGILKMKETNSFSIGKEEEKYWLKDTSTSSLRLLMAGDALYHKGVYQDGYQNGVYDFKKQLELIKPIVLQYDLAYYNQESILGGVDIGLSSYPRFNSPQEVGDAFLDAGFNLVSLSNNHTLDKGEKGVLASLEYWKEKPCFTAGSYSSYEEEQDIRIGVKNNIRYAFLSYTTSTNGLKAPNEKEYLVSVYDKEKVAEVIHQIESRVDVIIVAMHWGVEYNTNYTEEQKRIASDLADLGVTIVIGNHPHVIEPVVKIKDTLVFYSLGNFIAGQDKENTRIGLMPSLEIVKRIEKGVTTIEIQNVEAELVYTSRDSNYRNFKIVPFSSLEHPKKEEWQTYFEEIVNVENLVTFVRYNS